MIASVLFIFTRIVQIVFLIPIIGMMVSPQSKSQSDPQEPKHELIAIDGAGLLCQWLPQCQHHHAGLHPSTFHCQRDRRLLVPGHRHPLPDRT